MRAVLAVLRALPLAEALSLCAVSPAQALALPGNRGSSGWLLREPEVRMSDACSATSPPTVLHRSAPATASIRLPTLLFSYSTDPHPTRLAPPLPAHSSAHWHLPSRFFLKAPRSSSAAVPPTCTERLQPEPWPWPTLFCRTPRAVRTSTPCGSHSHPPGPRALHLHKAHTATPFPHPSCFPSSHTTQTRISMFDPPRTLSSSSTYTYTNYAVLNLSRKVDDPAPASNRLCMSTRGSS